MTGVPLASSSSLRLVVKIILFPSARNKKSMIYTLSVQMQKLQSSTVQGPGTLQRRGTKKLRAYNNSRRARGPYPLFILPPSHHHPGSGLPGDERGW